MIEKLKTKSLTDHLKTLTERGVKTRYAESNGVMLKDLLKKAERGFSVVLFKGVWEIITTKEIEALKRFGFI